MSFQATSWALRQQTGGHGPKLLLLVLANHASPAGIAFPGRKTLADECECRPATITANMKLLESVGLIRRHERRRQSGSRTSDWIILAPKLRDRGEMLDADPDEYPQTIADQAKRSGTETESEVLSGSKNDPGQVRFSGGPYEQSEEQSATPSLEDVEGVGNDGPSSSKMEVDRQPVAQVRAREGAQGGMRARRPFSYRGRSVSAELELQAECLLGVFNDATGKRFGPWTADGRASPTLKQVAGALLDEAEDLQVWARGIRSMAQDPPSWLDGPWTVGHMFGERARQTTLARGRGEPAVSNGRRESAFDCAQRGLRELYERQLAAERAGQP
jgi:helix-turn-helix protein